MIKNKKKTIFYRTYHKHAQELAEKKWQTSKKDITILNDRHSQAHNLHNIRLSGSLYTYLQYADVYYPSVYPSELRCLLYIFHNVLHYSFRPSPAPSPEDIHKVALITHSSDHQVSAFYRLAREQPLITTAPQA